MMKKSAPLYVGNDSLLHAKCSGRAPRGACVNSSFSYLQERHEKLSRPARGVRQFLPILQIHPCTAGSRPARGVRQFRLTDRFQSLRSSVAPREGRASIPLPDFFCVPEPMRRAPRGACVNSVCVTMIVLIFWSSRPARGVRQFRLEALNAEAGELCRAPRGACVNSVHDG